MKKIFLSMFALMLLVPLGVSAATYGAADTYTHPAGEVAPGNLYAAAREVIVAGEVSGDVLAAGSEVSVAGAVGGDIFAVGSDVDVAGTVSGDVRAAGATITVSKNVAGDLVAAGGVIHVVKGVVIGGDLLVAGGQVKLEGDVQGNVSVSADELVMNGSVGGVVLAQAEHVELGPNANLAQFNYTAPAEATMASGATVAQVDYTQAEVKAAPVPRADMLGAFLGVGAGVFGFLGLWALFSCLTFALVLVWLFRRKATAVVKRASNRFGLELVRGLAIFIITPIVLLVVFITLFGSSIAVFGVTVYLAFLMLAKAIASILLGAWIFRVLRRDHDNLEVSWRTALVGVVVLYVIGTVPIFGWIIKWIMMCAALGAIGTLSYKALWELNGRKRK